MLYDPDGVRKGTRQIGGSGTPSGARRREPVGVIVVGVQLRLSFVAAVLLALLAMAGIAGLADKARSASS